MCEEPRSVTIATSVWDEMNKQLKAANESREKAQALAETMMQRGDRLAAQLAAANQRADELAAVADTLATLLKRRYGKVPLLALALGSISSAHEAYRDAEKLAADIDKALSRTPPDALAEHDKHKDAVIERLAQRIAERGCGGCPADNCGYDWNPTDCRARIIAHAEAQG